MDSINIVDISRQIFKYLGDHIYSLYAVSKYFAHEVNEYVYSMQMPHRITTMFPTLIIRDTIRHYLNYQLVVILTEPYIPNTI